jgi:hypothetical protein
MAERYQQFLGNRLGIVVELIEDSGSPYRVRTEDAFEFSVGAEDFRSYYRKLGEPTPRRWDYLITDPDTGFVDSRTVAKVMELIHLFQSVFQDFQKARSVVGDLLREIADNPEHWPERLQAQLKESGSWSDELIDECLARLTSLGERERHLLLSNSFAVIQWPALNNENGSPVKASEEVFQTSRAETEKSLKNRATRTRWTRMKNVEMTVEDKILFIQVDLAKEFGLSKSGKTIIVASSEGTKAIPGREERIGLNVYRQESKKSARGRRSSFKNVHMAVHKDVLTITVDLSQEVGPSKSGKTTIVGSTGGNQLVPGRSEKIGLNVYKKTQ